jgi:type I pantothenate kinase
MRTDPAIVSLAASLADAARGHSGAPYVVGVVGPVAVGKSTTAAQLAGMLGEDGGSGGHGLGVAVVATDAFLLPNAQLEELGGAMVKGYPQSYDWAALGQFLTDVRSGAPVLRTPIYSHDVFDVVPDAQHILAAPDVLVVEGLNLLQAPPDAPFDCADLLDRSIYVDAPDDVIERWFVDRFLALSAQGAHRPESFYAMFASMSDDEVASIARWTWSEINEPNLRRHVAPTRGRADVVVHKAADHSVVTVDERA